MDWKAIFDHLKQGGFCVYAPGQHQGICLESYLVLLNNGTGIDYSLECREYEILVYCPYEEYSEFETFMNRVKNHMNQLFPAVILIDGEQPHYPDDDLKAYMTSLIYTVHKPSQINRMN